MPRGVRRDTGVQTTTGRCRACTSRLRARKPIPCRWHRLSSLFPSAAPDCRWSSWGGAHLPGSVRLSPGYQIPCRRRGCSSRADRAAECLRHREYPVRPCMRTSILSAGTGFPDGRTTGALWHVPSNPAPEYPRSVSARDA